MFRQKEVSGATANVVALGSNPASNCVLCGLCSTFENNESVASILKIVRFYIDVGFPASLENWHVWPPVSWS